MKTVQYETFEHGADIGIRGHGATLEEAFVNGARALFSIVVDSLDNISPADSKAVKASSYDREGLFVAWLNALLAEADLENMVFCSFEVNIHGFELHGRAWGETPAPGHQERGVEVKGATFTELKVAREKGVWVAQCVVDV